MSDRLPPTDPNLANGEMRPYFVWWDDVTVADLHRLVRSTDPEERGYWMGAILQEANTRDVWLFMSADEIRANWSHVLRHLGRARAMWGYLLGLDATWPPAEARGA